MSRHLGSVSELRRSRAYRSIARAVIASQLLMMLPEIPLSAAARSPMAPSAETERAASRPQPKPERVVVNRTVPRVTPPPTAPSFSEDPTDLEFRRVRIFAEALVPLGRPTRPEENRALAAALMAYVQKGESEAVAGMLEFLLRFPDSPWRPSLIANVGTVFSQTGHYSRALRSWDEAWRLTKAATDVNGRAVADYALGEWLDLVTRLGQSNLLSARLEEIKDRGVGGAAAEKVTVAREGLWILTNRHHDAVASASVAVGGLVESLNKSTAISLKTLTAHHPIEEGTSLAAVQRLARSVGFAGRMAYRTRDVEPFAPAILHLKLGHYAALVKIEGDRYFVRDAILGDRWITRQALDDEQSGYFLIPEGTLPAGWRPVEDNEAAVVIGHCAPGAPDANDPGPGPCPVGECEPGMPTYNFHPVTASLRIHDAPLSYLPARGPAVFFSVHYNLRDTGNPQVPVFSHLGPQWELDWLSYVQEYQGGDCSVYGCTFTSVGVNLRGYGGEEYLGAPDFTADFGLHWRSRARLVRTSLAPIRYERRLPDGSVEVFELSDGAPVRQRRVFLTRVIDPQGQQVELTYDSSFRLVALADATGQVTTVHYESAADPLRVTKVTDPYGRFATFTYDEAGHLVAITDVIGMTSSFAYGSGDFITAMTTPYGTTTFRKETMTGHVPRFIEATDPTGGTERLEYHTTHPSLAETAPGGEVPTGFTANNANLHKYVTLAWSKRAMALHPGDVSKATLVHWLFNRPVQAFLPFMHHASSIPHSIKRPLERREWFTYPNQTSTGTAGDGTKPAKVARVMDDGASQIWQATYNAIGHVTSQTDPLGRETSYTYAPNNIDLLEVSQTTGAVDDLLASYSNYTSLHLPQTITDGAGESAMVTYNAYGDVLTYTNAKSETTTYAYDVLTGRLQSVTLPASGATTAYTYDGYGRVFSITNSDTYSQTYQYDGLDRLTHVTYPDGSQDRVTYDKLDVATVRDRLGRSTRFLYDALRRRVAMRDQLGRVTSNVWCQCGSLDALIDAKGQKTTFEYDLQSRLIRERRGASGQTITEYAYENSIGRLKTLTDPRLQVKTYTYNLDDTIQSKVYTNAAIATPSVTYTYDTAYARLTGRTDGTGTTSYTFHPAGAPGAGHIATVDGPLTNDAVAYQYDELGRATSLTVDGVTRTWTYDALGRVGIEVNVLGAFTYGYDATTDRLLSVTYPSGQTSTAIYFGNTGDRRTETVHHRRPGGATLSKFDYTYDKVGNILSWEEQADANPATRWEHRYDGADQLISAIQSSTGGTPSVLKRYRYAYDSAGNRTTEQIGDVARQTSYDNLNGIVEQRAGGALFVAGTVNEPATVTIQGRSASVNSANAFGGHITQASGTTSFAVQATDGSGNTSTANFEVTASGGTTSFTFDANGNLTADGTRTFEWDAEDRLVAINVGTHRSEFTYDGLSRRTRIVEKENGVTTRDGRLIWANIALVEERLATGEINRFFTHGEQHDGTARYLTRDHLGSIRDVTDASGSVIIRNDYDPYGRLTRVVGSEDSRFGFTGLYFHPPSGLTLPWYRAYDPALGRWLSDDPIGVEGGLNFQVYAGSNPVRYRDPDGRNPLAGVWPGVQIGGTIGGPVGAIAGGIVGGIVTGLAAAAIHEYFVKPPADAYDPNGAKAPGKPPAETGFRDPKGGENWVPNPNPYGKRWGWEDDSSRVWVPTGRGPFAHGGPHWDVQLPDGTHINVRPPQPPGAARIGVCQ